jgi:hypothetical protein
MGAQGPVAVSEPIKASVAPRSAAVALAGLLRRGASQMTVINLLEILRYK